MHNEDDNPCATHLRQGDISENGQRYTHTNVWGAETVGYSNTVVANDWVTYGFLIILIKGLMYSLASISPLTTGTSAALRDRID